MGLLRESKGRLPEIRPGYNLMIYIMEDKNSRGRNFLVLTHVEIMEIWQSVTFQQYPDDESKQVIGLQLLNHLSQANRLMYD